MQLQCRQVNEIVGHIIGTFCSYNPDNFFIIDIHPYKFIEEFVWLILTFLSSSSIILAWLSKKLISHDNPGISLIIASETTAAALNSDTPFDSLDSKTITSKFIHAPGLIIRQEFQLQHH